MKNVIIFVSIISFAIISFVLITAYAKEHGIDLKYEKSDYNYSENQTYHFEFATEAPVTKSFWDQVRAHQSTTAETIVITDEEGNTVTDEEGNPVTELANPPVTDIPESADTDIKNSEDIEANVTDVPIITRTLEPKQTMFVLH